MSPEERLVRLETQMANVLEDFHEMKTDIRAIRDTLQEARGGWKALMFVGGAGAALGASVAKFLPFFVR
jgi:hypothetical protein